MFNFLNTSVLFAAAAALIPLLIHLFSRRKVQIVEFSSLKHLKAMQRRQVRRLKIRQLLLLLLRMIIILLVVLAFARPTTESGSMGSHASVSAVVLFDNSASMNRYVSDGNLFEIAKNRTSKILESFGEGDQVALLTTTSESDNNESAQFRSAAAAQEYLKTLETGYLPGDMSAGLAKAAELLKEKPSLNRELYIVTDRQRYGLSDSAYLDGVDASLYLVDLPLEAPDNCGIVSIDFGGQMILPGHDFNLTARVKNYGSSDKENLIASLILDGNRVAQTDFSIDKESEMSVRFQRSVSGTGFHQGYIEISDDKFPSDNRFYFSFRIPEFSSLLIIDGDRTGQLIKLALTPNNDINNYWSVKISTPEELSGVRFWEYDAVLVAGAPTLSAEYIERLKSYLNRGKTLIVTYGDETDMSFFNSSYSEICGLKLVEPYKKDFTRAGYYSIASLDINHAVFSVFNFENNKPPEIKFYTLPRFDAEPDCTELLSFTGDRIALGEYPYKNGKTLTFTGMLSPVYSDISSHSFFVPFLSRLVEYAANDLSGYDFSLYCGNSIRRTLGENIAFEGSLELMTPDSLLYDLNIDDSRGSESIVLNPTRLPGIYRISYEGRLIDMAALNVNPDECDLSMIDSEQLASSIGAEQMKTIEYTDDPGVVLSSFRYGRELWQIFIYLALLALAAEMLLSRSRIGEE